MQNALVFLFVLSVLVVVHEFGHFIVARMVGIRVEKFSIGFGPVLFGKRFGDTEFVFSLLPLGGFVKMAGENPDEARGMEWEFRSKSLLQKFAVVSAGPLMNALLAFVIFTLVLIAGQPTLTSRVGRVLEGAPAEAAGLLAGDKILAIDGGDVATWEDVLRRVHQGGERILFRVEREGLVSEVAVVPKSQDASGRPSRVAFVGVAPSTELMYVKSAPVEAVYLGAKRVWDMTGMILQSLGMMVTGAMPFKESVTGPIGIYFMTGEAAKLGSTYLFLFMGSLSVSLFVLNLLPVPVLDGGHILFILIEKLKGSPISETVKERVTQVGLVMLLALMAFVIFQDLSRFAIFENIGKLFRR